MRGLGSRLGRATTVGRSVSEGASRWLITSSRRRGQAPASASVPYFRPCLEDLEGSTECLECLECSGGLEALERLETLGAGPKDASDGAAGDPGLTLSAQRAMDEFPSSDEPPGAPRSRGSRTSIRLGGAGRYSGIGSMRLLRREPS
ncbi:hypothetical protein GCM10027091_07680 [Streptomyces daliensis]